MSLFERLINNKVEFVTLTNQRRMRPEIASVMRILYPQLTDDQRVKRYPNIMGVNKNLYFLNHNRLEGEKQGIPSKFNEFEAKMIANFTLYLIH